MRARNIKPGLFRNEILGAADPLLTILFEGLWCCADREGRLEDRPLRIKADVLPYRENLDINRYLTVLAQCKFILRYKHGEDHYIQVLNFLKHQNPHKTEKPSIIPEFSDSCTITVNGPLNNGSRPADSLIPDSGFTDSLIPEKEKKERPTPSRDESRADCVDQIFSHWKERLNHPKAQLGEKRKKLIIARMKDGYSVEDLKEAIDGCARSPYHQGGNTSGMVYDTIELICRDAQHVDQFRKIAIDGPPQLSQAGIRTAMAAQEFISG